MSTVRMNVEFGRNTIETRVTSDISIVDRVIRDIMNNTSRNKKIIGLDTEWKVTGSKSATTLLVICDGEFCLIYKICGTVPETLLNFLRLPEYMFVGMGIKSSLAKLENEYGLGCKNAIELGPLAAQVMQNPMLSAYGVDELALKVDSIKLEGYKETTYMVFNNWGNDVLHRYQIEGTTLNAFAYYKIAKKLKEIKDVKD